MVNVKNERNSERKRGVTVSEWEQMKGLKPLKIQGFEAPKGYEVPSRTSAGSRDAAPGAGAAGPGAAVWIAGAVAVGVLLTYGNVLMEMFFHLIGV